MDNISVIDIINVIAIAISPAIAVYIGRRLENKAEQRRDKVEIFKTLMTARVTWKHYGWQYESIRALNIIDVVFADDKNVRQTWKELYSKCCNSNISEIEIKEIEKLVCKLIENIAISLGYKDKITWETIQNPYMPGSVKQQLDNQNTCQQLSPLILSEMYNVMNKSNLNLNNNASSQNENTTSKKE